MRNIRAKMKIIKIRISSSLFKRDGRRWIRTAVEDLGLVKANNFDLVITDMTMPKMTGKKLAAEVINIGPDIPVILSSGYSKKLSDERAAELGIKVLLMKPVSKNDLANTV